MRNLLALSLALLIAHLTASTASAGPDDRAVSELRSPFADMRIVFVAMDRAPDGRVGGLQQIFTANGDGTSVRLITSPTDGNFYDWAVWAFNGSKIVYTQRVGEALGGEEAIWMMDPDGSHRRKLSSNPWRNAQPKVSPDGRSLVFASSWDESPQLGIFKMDLATLQVEDLTARGGGAYSFESDPSFSADGRSIVFAYSGGRRRETTAAATQIWTMNADGTEGRPLTSDAYSNTDPAISPDGRYVAISSYRGLGTPRHAWPPQNPNDIYLQDWKLVVRDIVGGTERALTQGRRCDDLRNPCTADVGPAWVPRWSPDGTHLAYLTIRSPIDSGIAVVSANGSDAHPLIELKGRAITWWDWTDGRHSAAEDAAATVGEAASKVRLLYVASVFDQISDSSQVPSARLFSASPDRWVASEITPKFAGMIPSKARWTRDRRHIVFTSRVKVDRASPLYSPAPPQGRDRRIHFTFADLSFVADSLESQRASGDIAEEQIFIMKADGSDVRQMTTPWTEDYWDAIPDGDARGNTDPDVSPDGRYLVFTNVSAVTHESFILRMDLETGEVINLTNMTAGAVPVADSSPRYSPDGSQLAFASSTYGGSQIYLMRVDGTDVRGLTDDVWANLAPAWSPDGKSLVYSSYRGQSSIDEFGDPTSATLPAQSWFAVALDIEKGIGSTVAGGDRIVLWPQWTPDGNAIAFISMGSTQQPDIYVVRRDGQGLHALQTTIRSKELFFDWR